MKYNKPWSVTLAILIFMPLMAFCEDTVPMQIGISVDFDQAHVLHKNVYGVNNYIATRPYYNNHSGFINKYEDLGKPCIRYPGGTFSNYYDFTTGFAAGYENITEADSIRRVAGPNSSIQKYKGATGGEDYRRFCDFVRRTDAEFTYSLNIILHTAEENRALFEGFKAEGVELQNVEMGNELYFGSYNTPVPEIETYVQLAKANTEVLKEVFPDAKVGVLCPSHIYTHESFLDEVDHGVTTKQTEWFEKLQDEDFYDALIIHMYSTVGMNASTPASEFLPYTEAYRYSISHSDGKYDESVEALRTAYPGKEVWVTEYQHGGFSGDVRSYRLRYSYLGGFFTAQFLNKMFNTPEISLGSWHSLVQWLTFSGSSTLLPDDYNFGTKVNYHLFKTFREPVEKSESVAPVRFSGNAGYQGVGEYAGIYSDLEGSLFYSGNRAWLLLFNKLEQVYALSIDSLLSGVDGLEGAALISCRELGPSDQMDLEDALSSESEYSSSLVSPDTGFYTLNPYSVYVFEYSHLTLEAGMPDPADGEEIYADSVLLKWLPGHQSQSSDLYFGNSYEGVRDASSDAQEYLGNVDSSSINPGPLIMDTVYYWRVDAVGPDTTVKGKPWSFQTVGDTTTPVYHALLALVDRNTGEPIYRVSFSYDNRTFLSNRDGEIGFDLTEPFSLEYTAEHDKYFTLTGNLDIIGDTSITLEMTPRIAKLTFQISDGQDPINGVRISLGSIYRHTDADGQVLFLNQPARQTYGYLVEKEGYTPLADSVYLETDTTLNINLQLLSLDTWDNSTWKVFPNPAETWCQIDMGNERAHLSLLSLSGKLLLNAALSPGLNKLVLSSLDPGVYILIVRTDQHFQYQKLHKL